MGREKRQQQYTNSISSSSGPATARRDRCERNPSPASLTVVDQTNGIAIMKPTSEPISCRPEGVVLAQPRDRQPALIAIVRRVNTEHNNNNDIIDGWSNYLDT
jgi:hypothetical protein